MHFDRVFRLALVIMRLAVERLASHVSIQHCRIDARKYFFSSRVITIWNQLPAEVFNAVTVAAFVAKLRSCDLSRYLLEISNCVL